MSGAGNVPKKPRFIKVSEIEYKIIFLENKSSALSEKEIERLNSLKEQKLMQENLGVNIRKTAKVPTVWIAVNKKAEMCTEVKKTAELSAELKNTTELPTEVKRTAEMAAEVTSSTCKQTYSNAFLQFQSEKKQSLLLLNPAAKLNLTEIREEWRTLTDSGKAPYKKAACDEKKMIGINFRSNFKEKTKKISEEERKKLKTETDRKHRLKIKTIKVKKEEKEQYCLGKFKEILIKKEVQLEDEAKEKHDIEVRLVRIKTENDLVQEMIKDKGAEVELLKEKYRALHKIHKSCSLSKEK